MLTQNACHDRYFERQRVNAHEVETNKTEMGTQAAALTKGFVLCGTLKSY